MSPITEVVMGLICVLTKSAPVGIRTPNLLIRSQMLYPLSYGRMSLRGLGNSSRWETPGGNRGPLLVT